MSHMEFCPEEAQFLGYDNGSAQSAMGESAMHASLAQLVRQVHSESRPQPEEVAERFAALAPVHIDGADEAGAMLTSGRRGVRSSAPVGSCAYVIDGIAEELQEGPTLQCAATDRVVRVDELADDTRWPRFAEAVLAKTPVRSLLSFQLYTHVQNWGALSLYSYHPRRFAGTAEQLGLILATHAALTLEAVQRTRQFRSALGSRDIIGQAKGILMERYDMSSGAAFALLTRLSQESSKPVVVIAKELVETKPKSAKS